MPMSDLLCHKQGERVVAIALPHRHSELLADWGAVRSRMVRNLHPDFTRAEWAYLIQFLDPLHLQSTFDACFGTPVSDPAQVHALLTPRKKIAIWLPNNVSLLGPLTAILLSLAGCELRIKAGSRSRDLCSSLFDWLRSHCPDGALKTWLHDAVNVASFDRQDPRSLAMADWADIRILFGSDQTATAIERLDHPYDSQCFYFAHKVSEAWIDPHRANPATARDLARVFGIYGQAGCTSPKRVVLINGSDAQAQDFAEMLATAWPASNPELQPRHVASETAMAIQWGRALGQQVLQLGRNSGLAVVGPAAPIIIEAHMAIAIQWGSLEQVLSTQPANLQTIGHVLENPADSRWLSALAHSPALRFVPLTRMHHFGPVWDGVAWWSNLFIERVLESGT